MRNESFYSSIAQVLPTLLVAIAVEFNVIWENWVNNNRGAGGPFGYPMVLGTVAIRAGIVGLVALLGELAALAVVFFGTTGWLPYVAGPLVALATILLLVIALYLPISRFLNA